MQKLKWIYKYKYQYTIKVWNLQFTMNLAIFTKCNALKIMQHACSLIMRIFKIKFYTKIIYKTTNVSEMTVYSNIVSKTSNVLHMINDKSIVMDIEIFKIISLKSFAIPLYFSIKTYNQIRLRFITLINIPYFSCRVYRAVYL